MEKSSCKNLAFGSHCAVDGIKEGTPASRWEFLDSTASDLTPSTIGTFVFVFIRVLFRFARTSLSMPRFLVCMPVLIITAVFMWPSARPRCYVYIPPLPFSCLFDAR